MQNEPRTTLIKGGTVVTAERSVRADVLIEGESIAAVGPDLPAEQAEVIDAAGKFVLPGGIDVHTHLDMPLGDIASSDDFYSGHVAAAYGGTTTHLDFANQTRGGTLRQAIDDWHARATGKACIDYGFHVTVTDVNERTLEEIGDLPGLGVSTIKMLMAYKGRVMVDDASMFLAMERARDAGILSMVHCENGDVIDILIRQALEAGHTEPRWHALTRPPQLEGEATGRAIAMAQILGAPLYVVHVTCESSLRRVREAREEHGHAAREGGGGRPILRATSAGGRRGGRPRGYPLGASAAAARPAPFGDDTDLRASHVQDDDNPLIHAETCVQYLFCTRHDLERPGFEGAKWVCSPPFREETDHAALWQALADGSLDVVSTDHCPFWYETQKTLGRGDFSRIPNGCPGVEDRLIVLHHAGVNGGHFDLNRFVALTATNPARIFGMGERKGTVAPGYDADLAVWDMDRPRTITAANTHSRVDYNLYEGMTVRGVPEKVMRRGTLIVDGDSFLAQPGSGRYVARELVS